MGKKIKTNIIIIAVSIIACIIGVVLAFVFDLYSYIGTVGGIIFNACVFFGVFGILEIDDWTIWYKRILIRKFNKTTGTLDMKVYDKYLKKSYITLEAKIDNYLVNNDQAPIFEVILKHGDSSFTLPCSVNVITGGLTIIDIAGKDYKTNKLQIDPINCQYCYTYLHHRMEDFTKWLSKVTDIQDLTFNPDSLTYNKK